VTSETDRSPYRHIQCRAEARVGRITLHRPEVMNALNPEMMGEIAEAMAGLERDEAVRAIIIDAVGKGFSAGGDKGFLDAVGNLRPFEIHDQVYAYFGAAVRAVKLCPKPTVAAVNGPAYGAGCEIALACDFRVASTEAAFAENWIKLGLISPLGGMLLLPRIVGLTKATEMLMLGQPVDAEEALRIGLVNEVVAPEALAERAGDLARRLADGPPLGLAAMKEGLRRGLESTLAQEWEHNVYVQAMLIDSGDFQEGVAALTERRKPNFQGR
jgi:enoyl-CoA hydratase/carnithine racemase